ncbi:MAG: hypothetical protein FJW20_13615 [Acidimicrobiia bacterium]|nr:hypothetical protein [Acidimicrobiia bacterium]
MTGTRRTMLRGLFALLTAGSAVGQRRRRVRRAPVRRTRVVVHPRHPIVRAHRRTVVVRPARRAVVVTAPLVFLPAITVAAVAATLPARERLVWQDTEEIDREEEWVESNFGIDERGDALYLQVDGKARLDFADVTFENGNVQVVDFNEKEFGNGIYKIHDFRDGRHVKTVRLVAKAETEEATLRMFLSK